MTIAQATRAANDSRPISYRERSEALRVLKDAVDDALVAGFYVLAKSRQARLNKLMELKP
ncbi:hypothetical protein LCGC14_2649600 [marine sediment metagenome]|uniref:Uncharacterized protein n=1 Tax=marine sediment metagenome TaxID=412755 RepID=A0A0F8ZV26_9ZZZZ